MKKKKEEIPEHISNILRAYSLWKPEIHVSALMMNNRVRHFMFAGVFLDPFYDSDIGTISFGLQVEVVAAGDPEPERVISPGIRLMSGVTRSMLYLTFSRLHRTDVDIHPPEFMENRVPLLLDLMYMPPLEYITAQWRDDTSPLPKNLTPIRFHERLKTNHIHCPQLRYRHSIGKY